jgi:GNAT superfamily N-acetyltransferase
LEIIKLVGEKKIDLWNNYKAFDRIFNEVGAPFPPMEHLKNIIENNGEKIIAYEDGIILGWIGIIPSKSGQYSELAGIEVDRNFRRKGIASILINDAQSWLLKKNIREFRFQTSPLLTANTLLYLTKFRTTYKWNNKFTIPPNRTPWPVVDCKMCWPIREDTNKNINFDPSESVLQWNDYNPFINEESMYSDDEYKFVILPFLDLPIISNDFFGSENKINIIFEAFNSLAKDKYCFKEFIYDKDINMFIYTFKKQ